MPSMSDYGNGVGGLRPGPHCSLNSTSPHRDVLLLTYLHGPSESHLTNKRPAHRREGGRLHALHELRQRHLLNAAVHISEASQRVQGGLARGSAAARMTKQSYIEAFYI